MLLKLFPSGVDLSGIIKTDGYQAKAGTIKIDYTLDINIF